MANEPRVENPAEAHQRRLFSRVKTCPGIHQLRDNFQLLRIELAVCHGRWPTGARAMFCAVGSTGIPADHALLRRRLEALANLATPPAPFVRQPPQSTAEDGCSRRFPADRMAQPKRRKLKWAAQRQAVGVAEGLRGCQIDCGV
ncbi:hypothetical protein VTN96DRAFT_4010 [Rasamsonia emersonii]